MRVLIMSVILTLWLPIYGQMKLVDVDLDQIPQKKIRKYIKEQKENKIETVSDIHPTLTSDKNPKDYNKQKIAYRFKENINTVWENYVKTSPAESWEGKRISFGVLFSKAPEKIVYRGDDFSKIDSGQVIFLNLKILRGVYNLAMAFEVISVDVKNKIIEFSYIKGNKSQGKQQLQFYETSDNKTVILHSSYFKSNSKFRDKVLYPFFHRRTTNEFHRNMRRIIKKNSPNSH